MIQGLEQLQLRLQYRFQNPDLLRRALTHRSFSADHYERLEFLGDSVLGLAVSDMLYARLGSLASFGEESLAFVDWLRHSPPAPGSEGVVLPGEPERSAREQRSRDGIRIDDATWLEIVESCKKVGAQI